jgi:Omp85 superfamily domain
MDLSDGRLPGEARDGEGLRRVLCVGLCLLLPCAATARGGDDAGGDKPDKKEERTRLPDRIERAAKRVSQALKQRKLYPYVTSLATGGGAAPGLAYFDTGLGLYGGVSESLKGDSLVELRVGRIPHVPDHAPSRRPGLEWMPGFVTGEDGQGRFFVYGQAKRLDLGPGRYLQGGSDPLRQESLDVVAGYRLSSRLALQVQGGMLSVSPGPGAETSGLAFAPALDAPGLAWKRDFLHLGSELARDTRLQPGRPDSGSFASLRLDHYQGRDSTPGFSRASLDVRRYQALGSARHVVAVRGLASFANTDGIHVPYYLQDSLGGASILRSYPEHRFSGDRLLAFSAEYRFQALPWLQLAAFYDGGRAWSGFPTLDSGGLRSSTGLGVRLTTRDHVLLRLDAARGDEGTRLNLKVGYSF